MFGLLAMTSEWTQRTALTTFTMSPRRLRMFAAKFIAALVLSFVVLVVTVLMTAVATVIGGIVSDGSASFAGIAGAIRSTMITTLLQVVMAAAIGALIPWSAVAIGCFIAAPTVWAAVAPSLLGGTSKWFDIFETYARLGSSHPSDQTPQTLTSIAVWVLVPGAAGLYRSVRRDVK